MFRNGVIDTYMPCILQNLKKNAQVSIYAPADLNKMYYLLFNSQNIMIEPI